MSVHFTKGYIARFQDGPLADLDWEIHFSPAFERARRRLYFAPMTDSSGEWFRVGDDFPPEPPYPGQLEYVLERLNFRDENEPVGYYRLAKPAQNSHLSTSDHLSRAGRKLRAILRLGGRSR